MKWTKLFVIVIVLLLLTGLITTIGYFMINQKQFYNDGFYVGVTYCGSSVQEAKEHIDKVK